MYLKGICFQNIPQLCGCACESNKLILNAFKKQKRELFSVHLSRTTKKNYITQFVLMHEIYNVEIQLVIEHKYIDFGGLIFS